MVFFPAGGFTYGASNDVESRMLPLIKDTQARALGCHIR